MAVRKVEVLRLEEMRNADIRTADLESLKDITKVKVDEGLSGADRVRDYLEQVGNPYLFRVGDVVVRCSYAEDGPTLNEQLRKLISLA